tara:strand:- start:348 stop:794 length:447 start_codon:yes stop_codon:yes gene_type:complete
MISDIKIAAESVGITAVITNSTEKIEVQLNKITNLEDLPIMLVSWDLNISLNFNDNGFLDNPVADVVALLMMKPEDLGKDSHEAGAEEMYFLYLDFIQALRDRLSLKLVNYPNQPITSVTCGLVPRHGLGKHAGVLGKFSMITAVSNC